MKQATKQQLLQAHAKGIYDNWTKGLNGLRTVGEPSARKMLEDELRETYATAQGLVDEHMLSGMSMTMMSIILSRSFEQWLMLNRSTHKSIISTY